MITAKRVYEVFGISQIAIEIIINEIDPLYSNRVKKVFKSSPEGLVALVNKLKAEEDECVIFKDENYFAMAKAIESADAKKRLWPELLKELEK